MNEALKAEVERLREGVRQDSERFKSKRMALRKMEAALKQLVNEVLKAEVERLREEVRQDGERLKSKKKALRKMEAALEELALSI